MKGVVDEIVDDETENSSAMAVDGVGETAGDLEGHVALLGGGEIAAANEVDEFVTGEFVGSSGGVIAEEGDGFLNHRLHAIGVVGSGAPIGCIRIFATADNGAEPGDGALQAVEEMRGDLAEGGGLGGEGEFEIGADELFVALGDRALRAAQAEERGGDNDAEAEETERERDLGLAEDGAVEKGELVSEGAGVEVIADEADQVVGRRREDRWVWAGGEAGGGFRSVDKVAAASCTRLRRGGGYRLGACNRCRAASGGAGWGLGTTVMRGYLRR